LKSCKHQHDIHHIQFKTVRTKPQHTLQN
jgi:hypothetical protein